MKLLFDQNLSPKLVRRLADLYPDSSHVYHVGIDRVDDQQMRDWIRRGNCSTAAIESILRDHNSDIAALAQDEIMGILTLF